MHPGTILFMNWAGNTGATANRTKMFFTLFQLPQYEPLLKLNPLLGIFCYSWDWIKETDLCKDNPMTFRHYRRKSRPDDIKAVRGWGNTKPSSVPTGLGTQNDGAVLEKVSSAHLGQSWPALLWPGTKPLGWELGREIGNQLVPWKQSQKCLRLPICMLLISLPVRETLGSDFYKSRHSV